MRLLVLFAVLMGYLLTGCGTIKERLDAAEKAFPAPDLSDDSFIMRCSCYFFESVIKQSDFCFIGQMIQTRHTSIDPDYPQECSIPNSFIVEGKVEVRILIYGNPKIEQFPYSYTYGRWGNPWICNGSRIGFFLVFFYPFSSPPDNGPVIALGKGAGKDATIRVIWDPIISPSAVKSIKELENLREKQFPKFQRRRDELLNESNDIEILTYLFRRAVDGGNVEEVNALLETLVSKDKVTPERKFLAYQFALYLTYYDYTYYNFDSQRKIKDPERKILVEFIGRRLAEVKTVKEGVRYLRSIDVLLNWIAGGMKENPPPDLKRLMPQVFSEDPRLFEKTPLLKDKIKEVTEDLSRRFEKEEGYPEWEGWLKKILLEETPSKENVR